MNKKIAKGSSATSATTIAQAAFATAEPIALAEGEGQEYDIQWMPPGYQEPVCFVNGQSRQLKFTCKAQHAEKINGILQALIAKAKSGRGDRPLTDYNHEDGAASGRPAKIYWGGDDLKTGGIRLTGKWTAKAREGIRDGEWDRFSPEWEFHPRTEEPIGISVNLGGLVNKAAFQTIARVVAKHGGAANNKQVEDMTTEEFQKIVADAIKPLTDDIAALKATGKSAETSASQAQAGAAEDKITKLFKEQLKPLEEKLTKLETAGTETHKAQAKSAVQKHVQRGAIAPQDNDSIAFWETSFLADPAKAETMMGKLPVARAGTGTRLTNSNGGSAQGAATATEPEEIFMAKAKEFGEKNKLSETDALIAFARTAEGAELQQQFREKVRTAK